MAVRESGPEFGPVFFSQNLMPRWVQIWGPYPMGPSLGLYLPNWLKFALNIFTAKYLIPILGDFCGSSFWGQKKEIWKMRKIANVLLCNQTKILTRNEFLTNQNGKPHSNGPLEFMSKSHFYKTWKFAFHVEFHVCRWPKTFRKKKRESMKSAFYLIKLKFEIPKFCLKSSGPSGSMPLNLVISWFSTARSVYLLSCRLSSVRPRFRSIAPEVNSLADSANNSILTSNRDQMIIFLV